MKGRLALAAVALAVHSALAMAQGNVAPRAADFTVGNIKVEGLQRISPGTVFNYLPINIGDELTPAKIRRAIEALYATGFFRDIEMRRRGNTLIVVVMERPSIESFQVTGNKAIKTKNLMKSLRNVGLAPGKIFNRSVLTEVTGYLTHMYYSRGKYGVRINTKVIPQTDNRVKIKIKIDEGSRAVIRSIDIVGDTRYPQARILKHFHLKTPGWLSWYDDDDRYSRASLKGDLERLRNFYMDRGYANFAIRSTQVQISPDRKNIYININIKQGEVYRISKVKLAGTFVVPERQLERLVQAHPGEVFDRALISNTQKLIEDRLGEYGYAFAKVDPVPTPNNKTHQVELTFFVDPGDRVYVRKITFSGETAINDKVLRRELHQLEGGWLSNVSLERGKQFIERLPYVKGVTYSKHRVPGSPDEVDVNYKIKQGPAAQLSGGLGYSATYKLMLNANFGDADFLGTGNELNINLSGGAFAKMYDISYTDPFITQNGVSQTLSLNYNDSTQFVSSSSQFNSKTINLGPEWSYPISEFQYLSFGASFEDAQLLTSSLGSSEQAVQWVRENGNPYTALVHEDYANNEYQLYGTNYYDTQLLLGYQFDDRNRVLFATRGQRFAVNGSITIPGSGPVQYFVASLDYQLYVPLWRHFILSFYERTDYGNGIDGTTGLPPYRLFYGGGPDSVRGFRTDWLGPRDQFGNPYGGNFDIVSQNELLLPIPKKWRQTAQVALFFDMGNVFYTGNSVHFFEPDNVTPVYYHFHGIGSLKRSVGLAVEWMSPMGLFRFSYGVPLNATRATFDTWGDQTQGFQFTVGQAF
jgi:outer membrane protein insertion porin family